MVDYRIRINEAKRELEITKAFANKANKYGTSEYDDLQKARRDYPKFKVVIRHTKKNVDGFKGLTLEYMEKYIKEHREIKTIDEETQEEITIDVLVEFYAKCGKDKDGKKIDFLKAERYGIIKKWFLEIYPVFEEYRQRNSKKSA